MLCYERVFEECYGGKKIHNIKVNNLDFYYISKNSNNDIIITLNKIGYECKRDYRILKLYETEFIQLKNHAINNICNIIDDLQNRFNGIINNYYEILTDNNNELLNLLLTGTLHNNNNKEINSITNNQRIINFINNYSDFSIEKYQNSIYRLNRMNYEIQRYKEILETIHNIRYSDIM